jgi:hypothetical protein
MHPSDPHRRRLALSTAACLLIALAGGVIVIARPDPDSAQTRPDLSNLDASMLINEDSVPAVADTSWGQMVAVPRGVAPPVSPAGCGLFLSQAPASQKGLAMRSSKGTAIGAELAITDEQHDLDALVRDCRTFSFDGGGTQARVELEALNIPDPPADTVGTLMRCQSVTAGKTLSWDIAMIAGYHRGVLVSVQYTPGPVGGPFDSELADTLPGIYRAQIAKLDGA